MHLYNNYVIKKHTFKITYAPTKENEKPRKEIKKKLQFLLSRIKLYLKKNGVRASI